jgi:hypothetical protein
MIGEALAFTAANRSNRPISVIVAESGAVVVTEVVFRKVSVQMFFLTMLINAAHSALEDRKEPFNRIGVNVVAHIFAMRVRDLFMRGEFLPNADVEAAFVGV